MNVTVRASLIALIAIVGVCWAIPVLLVSVVPSDAGMIAMMALIYPCSPQLQSPSVCSPRTPRGRSSGYPQRSESDPRSCFPSRSRAARTLRSMGLPIPQSATPPWACAPGRLLDNIAKPSPRKPPQARSPRAMARIAATIMQVNPMQNNFCSARQALPHMMYNRFDSAPDVFAGRSFTTGR